MVTITTKSVNYSIKKGDNTNSVNAIITSTKGFTLRPFKSKLVLLKIVQLLLMVSALVLLLLHIRRSSVFYDREGLLYSDQYNETFASGNEIYNATFLQHVKKRTVCLLTVNGKPMRLELNTFLTNTSEKIRYDRKRNATLYMTGALEGKSENLRSIECGKGLYDWNVTRLDLPIVAEINDAKTNDSRAVDEMLEGVPVRLNRTGLFPAKNTTVNGTVFIYTSPFNSASRQWTAMARGNEFYWAMVITSIITLAMFLILYAASTTGWILVTRTTTVEIVYNIIMAICMLVASAVAFFFLIMSDFDRDRLFTLPLIASILGLITGALYIVGVGLAHMDLQGHSRPSSGPHHVGMQPANLSSGIFRGSGGGGGEENRDDFLNTFQKQLLVHDAIDAVVALREIPVCSVQPQSLCSFASPVVVGNNDTLNIENSSFCCGLTNLGCDETPACCEVSKCSGCGAVDACGGGGGCGDCGNCGSCDCDCGGCGDCGDCGGCDC